MMTQLADILYYNSNEIGQSQVDGLNGQTDPVAAADFYSQNFEKRPCGLRRGAVRRRRGLLGTGRLTAPTDIQPRGARGRPAGCCVAFVDSRDKGLFMISEIIEIVVA